MPKRVPESDSEEEATPRATRGSKKRNNVKSSVKDKVKGKVIHEVEEEYEDEVDEDDHDGGKDNDDHDGDDDHGDTQTQVSELTLSPDKASSSKRRWKKTDDMIILFENVQPHPKYHLVPTVDTDEQTEEKIAFYRAVSKIRLNP